MAGSGCGGMAVGPNGLTAFRFTSSLRGALLRIRAGCYAFPPLEVAQHFFMISV